MYISVRHTFELHNLMTVAEYNKCVDLHSDNIFRFIVKNVKDDMKAEDIVQDTYEKLWKRFEEISFEKSKSYLFSTAYHTMIDIIRREKKQQRWDDVYENNRFESHEYDNLNEVLHEALNELPESQKSVIMLRDYEGYSYDEISEITGLNESQVKVYIYRGRLFLREYLEKNKISVI